MDVAPSGKPADVVPRPLSTPAPSAPADPVPDQPTRAPAPAESDSARGVPSSLKFTISAADVDATFAIHEELRRVMVTMTDRTSGEVLREIPSEEILNTILALRENGMLVDVAT
ncbi:MAG: flagellar protein FlaG [Miltoncostaeaceae bacterium]